MVDQDRKLNFVGLFISLGLHGILLGVAIMTAQPGNNLATIPKLQAKPIQPQPVVVQAHTVDKKALDKELVRLQKIDQDRKHRQAELRREAQRLQQKRRNEEKRLQALKQQQVLAQQKVAAQQRAEQERLTQQRQLADKKAKELSELKRQRQHEQEALLAAQKARAAAEVKREQALAEQQRLEQLRQAAEEQARQEAEQRRLAELRQQEERRARQQQQAEQERKLKSIVDRFGGLVRAKVAQNWIVQGTTEGAVCVLRVRLAPGGIVLDVEITESSGDSALDRSAVAAIYKSSPLPVPPEPDAFERMRELRLTLRPEDILNSG